MKKRMITTLAAVTICATVLLLGCIQPKEGVRLGYDLDRVELVRYNFTSRFPETTLPVSTWEVLLEVEKVGKKTYAITRTTTSYFGGLNGTFELDQEGGLSNVLLDEFSAGERVQPTGEWVTVTAQGNVSGRGYHQEIPPLPGGTVLLGDFWTGPPLPGDFWNGTFAYNVTSQTKGLTLDVAIISNSRGYVVGEAIRRKEMETPAGKFSVVEVESFGETTTETYTHYPNGTIKQLTKITLPYEGTYMIDAATGMVIYSVRAFGDEEPPNQRYEVVIELVEIRKS